jgi:hypothetical protein
MNCTHQTTKETWVESDDFSVEEYGHWEKITVSATKDLDTHRYQCTLCGEIMYYSGAAADFYKNGTRRGIFS